MIDYTKDLATWYPLLPKEYTPDQLSAIRDIKVQVVLETSDIRDADALNILNHNNIYAILVSLEEARVWVGSKLISVPLRLQVGVDSNSSTQLNSKTYGTITVAAMLSSGTNDGGLNGMILALNTQLAHDTYYIHPDCISVYIQAPTLSISGSFNNTSNGSLGTGSHISVSKLLVPGSNVYLSDGYNFAIDTSYGLLSFTGGSNLGLGIMRRVPDWFSTDETSIDPETGYFLHPAGEGLRSINGLADDVQIKGMGDAVVIVKTSDEVTTDEVDSRILVSVYERPNADDPSYEEETT